MLKDWRKVRKLKQSGEAFLQDDACAEIGPNVQMCRECRVDRSRKSEEPNTSPVFCRFYYFRRSVPSSETQRNPHAKTHTNVQTHTYSHK